MSTYWDVVCLDCGDESGLHLNHGDDACRELVKAKIALTVLALADITDLSISVPGERGHIDLSFYMKHSAHVLAAVSEYGEIDGDCNDYSGPGRCRREPNHSGEHDPSEVRPWSPEWKAVREAAAARRRTS